MGLLFHSKSAEVVISNAAYLDLDEAAGSDARIGLEEYLSVDLGSVSLASAEMVFTHGIVILAKHVDDRALFSLIRLVADKKLSAHKDIHSILLYLLVDLTVKVVRGRTLLARICEHTCAREFLLLDELAKLNEVLLSLSGETDDKGRADNDVGYLAAKL